MVKKVSKRPTTFKLTAETQTFLEKEAAAAGVGFTPFLRMILDDYAEWLKEQRRGRGD